MINLSILEISVIFSNQYAKVEHKSRNCTFHSRYHSQMQLHIIS